MVLARIMPIPLEDLPFQVTSQTPSIAIGSTPTWNPTWRRTVTDIKEGRFAFICDSLAVYCDSSQYNADRGEFRVVNNGCPPYVCTKKMSDALRSIVVVKELPINQELTLHQELPPSVVNPVHMPTVLAQPSTVEGLDHHDVQQWGRQLFDATVSSKLDCYVMYALLFMHAVCTPFCVSLSRATPYLNCIVRQTVQHSDMCVRERAGKGKVVDGASEIYKALIGHKSWLHGLIPVGQDTAKIYGCPKPERDRASVCGERSPPPAPPQPPPPSLINCS